MVRILEQSHCTPEYSVGSQHRIDLHAKADALELAPFSMYSGSQICTGLVPCVMLPTSNLFPLSRLLSADARGTTWWMDMAVGTVVQLG